MQAGAQHNKEHNKENKTDSQHEPTTTSLTFDLQ